MSQVTFLDPVVTAGPSLTGVGNGTLAIDRLTHFTTAQTYTLTCIAKSPDTIFSVVGSLDGAVGLATVGTQFYDDDLKIFLTIQQGSTAFEIGDVFSVTVDNGTDLNQDNIDDYDEQIQKNFGAGVKGTLAGDNNIRYSDSNVAAELFVNDLKYTAVSAGSAGNNIQIQYFDMIAAIAASDTISGFLWTAVNAGAAGNLINIEVLDDVAAGSEFVTVSGNDIILHIDSGVTTKAQLLTALDAQPALDPLVTYSMVGSPTDILSAPLAPNFLEGGADAYGEYGDEEVEVTGSLIKVYFESGKSTASLIKAAVDAFPAAAALVAVAIIGLGSEPQYAPMAATNLSGGGSKFFALNKHELTESGIFVEGNASLKLHDATVAGRQTVTKEATFKDSVTLDGGGNKIPDLQKYINWLIQDQKISMRTADHTKLSWSKPTLSFTADILINFNDTDHYNWVDSTESPITIADGESLYVILDRDHDVQLDPVVAAEVPEAINALRIASRFGDHLILWDNTLIRDGKSAAIGEGGSGSGSLRVNLYDPVSTTLPSGASATIDGVAVANQDLVLFSNLSSGNNRAYRATGVGTSIVWTAESVWTNGLDPETGEEVTVSEGTNFGLQHGIFNGTDFLFNDYVRFFNGVDYWELSSLKTLVLTPSTTDNVFTVAYVGSENMIVDFSIIRGTRKETGTLHITTDGTSVAVTTSGAYIGASGVTFSGDISASNLRLRYTADGSSGTPTLKYFVKRWSDAAGGPAGIPSYSGGSGGAAAGSNTQIQFNDGGNLGADADFTWDKTNNVLSLGDLDFTSLIGPITLLDNQASPTAAFSYNATLFPFVIIEFSVLRNGIYQLGRMVITNDATTVSMGVESVNTGAGTGITFSAAIVGANVEVQYTSTAIGFTGQLKYAARRWA